MLPILHGPCLHHRALTVMTSRRRVSSGGSSGCAGMTLMELLLVMIILGIMASMFLPNISGRATQAKNITAETQINGHLAMALDLFEMDMGRYPSTQEGLAALIQPPQDNEDQWRGPYLKKSIVPKDPWGRDYVYRCPGVRNKGSYDLASLGADGVPSDDDITNWELHRMP